MKSMMNFEKYSKYFFILALSVGMASCDNDDDVTDPDPMPDATGTITASDQTLSGNTLVIEDVTVGQDSWVVVRNTDDQTMAAEPYLIEDDEDGEVRIELNEDANLTGDADGDDFDVSLYSDNPTEGTPGTYDESIDDPIMDANDADVTQTVNTTAPSIYADDDQMVTEEGDVMFSNVNTGSTGGYIGLYGENEDGTPNYEEQVGVSEYIQPGASENVTARFNEGYGYETGQTYYPRLYTDNPADQSYTYYTSDGAEDIPETYGYDPTLGTGRFVRNSGTTATPGGFTVGNTGVGTGPGADM
ncbi:hypothetical protein RM549_06475 [Salegentibacter sp. F188]|uniref:DUF7282 domain-containing protein n=1 Tax=Autumnicola patrickiae TaxID=3075591 RepID=A0ABU3E0C1_9FLAO|nr:hypothetical protein [Salegentibacter sp. F188]MDT0689422.1 hypothetical protein [Salegentibacter sp. F188]